MTTRGDVRIDIDTHEDGTSAATSALDSLNDKLDEFASLKLESTLNLLAMAKDAIIGLGEVAVDLEQRLNISRAFESVKDGADKLIEAQLATKGLFSDTELKQRIMTMERLNISTIEQSSLLQSMTKLQQTTGEDAKAIFDKLIDTYTGSNDALKEFGIIVTNNKTALDEVAEAVGGVNLDHLSTGAQKTANLWDDLKDTTVGLYEEFRKGGIKGTEMAESLKHLKQSIGDVELAQHAAAASGYGDYISGINRETHRLTKANWALADSIWEAERAKRALAKSPGTFMAAPESATELSIEQGVTSAAEAQLEIDANKKKGKKRGRRGGGRRRRAEVFDLDAVLAMQDAVAAMEAVDLDPLTAVFGEQSQELQRTVELQQFQLETQLEITQGIGEQTAAQVDQALVIERQIIALEHRREIEQATLDGARDLISAEEEIHRKRMAGGKSIQRLAKVESAATKKKNDIAIRESKRQKTEFDSSMDYWGSVGKAIGETAAMLADNEQDRAGIMAAMAVLDATMAGIRIISDMGVAGIPLAAATIALGAATAAGYASASGSSKPPTPGGFGAFTATAIQERPDAAGAPVVMNFNAPGAAIGWTPQQVRSELGIDGDNGGMRGAAA